MLKNSREVIFSLLRMGTALGISLLLGWIIDGVWLVFLLIMPTLGAMSLFKKKAPVPDTQTDGKKAVIMLYCQIGSAEDVTLAENRAMCAISANPQFPVVVMVDLADQPIKEVREDAELIRLLEESAERVGACFITRKRSESNTSPEFIGQGRKWGAMLDLMRIMRGEETDTRAVWGDISHLRGIGYVALIDGEPYMDGVTDMLRFADGDEVIYPCEDGRFCGSGIISVKVLDLDLPTERILFCERLISGGLGERGIKVALGKRHKPAALSERIRDKSLRARALTQELSLIFSKRLRAYQKLDILEGLADLTSPLAITVAMLLSFVAYPLAMGRTVAAATALYLLPKISKQENFLGEVLLIPTYSAVVAVAIIKETIRLILRKNTLSVRPISPTWYVIFAEVVCLISLRSPSTLVRLLALITALLPIRLLFDSLPEKQTATLSYHDKRALEGELTLYWRFFEDHVTASDNCLPPESVRFCPSVTMHTATPSGIGVYLLCCLLACDKKLIDSHKMHRLLERTLATLVRLEKQNGVPFERYDTSTLGPLSHSINDGETGLYLACLVCLREGLSEYIGACKELTETVKTIEFLIAECDLSQVGNEYLFSQGRLASFLAVATRALPREHWQKLCRLQRSHGFKSGIISQFGSLDEYFVAEQFLPSPVGSLGQVSLDYCMHCHKRRAQMKNAPYGLAHSRFDSVDERMHYLARPHGAAQTAKNRTDGYVASAYASYLTLGYDPKGAIDNLSCLSKLNAKGPYGYFEGVDIDSGEVIKCYDTEHVGLSIIAIINATNDKIVQKRMARASLIRGALELLTEGMPKGENSKLDASAEPTPQRERFCDISLTSPRVRFCHSSGYTLIMNDTGDCFGLFEGEKVYRIPDSLVTDRSGLSFDISVEGEVIGRIPERCEFFGGGANYFYETDGIAVETEVSLCEGLACERRCILLKNNTDNEKSVSVRIRLESGGLGGVSIKGDGITLRSGNMYIGVGFVGKKPRVMPSRNGFSAGVAEAMPAHSQLRLGMYVLCARTLEELKNGVASLSVSEARVVPSPKQSASRRVAEAILSAIILSESTAHSHSNAVSEIGLDDNLLLVAVVLDGEETSQKCELYAGAFKALDDAGIGINLAYIFKEDADRTFHGSVIDAVKKEGLEAHIYSRIMPVNLADAPEGIGEKLLEAADYVCR